MHVQFLVISYAAFAFGFICLIFSLYGEKADNKRRRIGNIDSIKENIAYLELEQTFFSRVIAPVVKKTTKILKNSFPKKTEKKSIKKKKNEKLERQLRLAGIYISTDEFVFIKFVVMALFIFIPVFSSLFLNFDVKIKLLLILVGCMLGVLSPTLYLRSKVRGHQSGIRNQLPDAMDLLGVCMEAGLSFDSSLLKIAEKLRGPFVDELLIVHREMQMGRARKEALQNLSAASDIEELKTFASALVQGEQLGIPINNVMRVQSKQLRVTRSQKAREKGMKATIKMMLPMLAFIFPTILIIVMGPTILNIIEQFK